MDGELRIEAEAQSVVAQQPRADRMKGAGEGRRRGGGGVGRQPARQQALHPPVELAGGAPRKSREHDPPGVGAAKDQMGDAMREHIGLAGAGASDHQQRSRAVGLARAMLDGEALGVVQFAEWADGERNGGANHGGDHPPQQSCFAFCSQAAAAILYLTGPDAMDGPGYASRPDKLGAYTLRYLMNTIAPKAPRTMRMNIKIPTKLFPDALNILGPRPTATSYR